MATVIGCPMRPPASRIQMAQLQVKPTKKPNTCQHLQTVCNSAVARTPSCRNASEETCQTWFTNFHTPSPQTNKPPQNPQPVWSSSGSHKLRPTLTPLGEEAQPEAQPVPAPLPSTPLFPRKWRSPNHFRWRWETLSLSTVPKSERFKGRTPRL